MPRYKDPEPRTSIAERLAIFVEWRQACEYWYTLTQLATAVNAYEPSLHPALSALRRAGYAVSLKWVHSKKKYLYRIEKQKLKDLETRVAQAKR